MTFVHRQVNVYVFVQRPRALKKLISSLLLLSTTLWSTLQNSAHTYSVPQKSAFSQAEEEVKRYQEASPLPLEENPLNWWKAHETTYPFLATLAKRYLSIPGTSVCWKGVLHCRRDSNGPEEHLNTWACWPTPFSEQKCQESQMNLVHDLAADWTLAVHIFLIFPNLIEALSYSYLYVCSQIYGTLLCLLYVTLLYLNN